MGWNLLAVEKKKVENKNPGIQLKSINAIFFGDVNNLIFLFFKS